MGWSKNNFKKKSKWPSFNVAKCWAISVKISWIGPWVSRINWCEGHWCGSTYMVVRLFAVSSKTGKRCFFVFRLFLRLRRIVSQPYLHQSIPLTQGPIHEIFKNIFWELAVSNKEFWPHYLLPYQHKHGLESERALLQK